MAIQFQLSKPTQLKGSAKLSQDGKTLSQEVAVYTTIVGNTYSPKFDQADLVTFTVDASLSITDANASIQAQAVQYVANTYPDIQT